MLLYPTLENPEPPKITCIEVPSQGGIKLRAAFAIPPSPKGTMLILNGRAEFIERYFETINYLLKRGLAVATFDWRGQGGSDRLLVNRLRGYVPSFKDFDADIDAIFTRLLVAHCPKPFYGLGHSTGGHMMLRALRGRKWLEKAVIISPLMGFHYGAWPRPAAKLISLGAKLTRTDWAYIPGLPHLPMQRDDFATNTLTSDQKRWDRDISTLEQYPQLALGGPTFAWLNAASKSISELMDWPKARGPSCPTMIVMAGQDRVVNNEGTLHFLARAPGFSNFTIADSRHEILNEKDLIRERFLAALDAFILS